MAHVESGDVRIWFHVAGPDDGPPTVLVHGFASDYQLNWAGTRWEHALTSAGRLVVGIDLRGHGQSEKPHQPGAYRQQVMARDVVHLLDHLGIGRADLVGYSMGARIVMRVAADHPDRVWRAVLGGPGRLQGPERSEAIARALRGEVNPPDPVARLFREFALSRPVNDLEALACCIEGFLPDLTDSELATLDLPFLVVEAEREDIAPGGRGLAEILPRAEYLQLSGRTHLDAPTSRIFKEAAIEFLDA